RTFWRLLGLANIVDGSIWGIAAHIQQPRGAFSRAHPAEFAPIEVNFFFAYKLIEVERWHNRSHGETVRLRDIENVIGGDHGARARHILRHKTGISGNVFAHMGGQQYGRTVAITVL